MGVEEKKSKALCGASARDEATLDPDPGSESRGESQTWLSGPRPGSRRKGKREPSPGEKKLLTPGPENVNLRA